MRAQANAEGMQTVVRVGPLLTPTVGPLLTRTVGLSGTMRAAPVPMLAPALTGAAQCLTLSTI